MNWKDNNGEHVSVCGRFLIRYNARDPETWEAWDLTERSGGNENDLAAFLSCKEAEDFCDQYLHNQELNGFVHVPALIEGRPGFLILIRSMDAQDEWHVYAFDQFYQSSKPFQTIEWDETTTCWPGESDEIYFLETHGVGIHPNSSRGQLSVEKEGSLADQIEAITEALKHVTLAPISE